LSRGGKGIIVRGGPISIRQKRPRMTQLNDVARVLDQAIEETLQEVIACGYVSGGAKVTRTEALSECLEARLISNRAARVISRYVR
jgi:hypothetical protein